VNTDKINTQEIAGLVKLRIKGVLSKDTPDYLDIIKALSMAIGILKV